MSSSKSVDVKVINLVNIPYIWKVVFVRIKYEGKIIKEAWSSIFLLKRLIYRIRHKIIYAMKYQMPTRASFFRRFGRFYWKGNAFHISKQQSSLSLFMYTKYESSIGFYRYGISGSNLGTRFFIYFLKGKLYFSFEFKLREGNQYIKNANNYESKPKCRLCPHCIEEGSYSRHIVPWFW